MIMILMKTMFAAADIDDDLLKTSINYQSYELFLAGPFAIKNIVLHVCRQYIYILDIYIGPCCLNSGKTSLSPRILAMIMAPGTQTATI